MTEHICYKCKKRKALMASVYAPGTYFICDECIAKEEEATSKIAILGPRGIEFVDPTWQKASCNG